MDYQKLAQSLIGLSTWVLKEAEGNTISWGEHGCDLGDFPPSLNEFAERFTTTDSARLVHCVERALQSHQSFEETFMERHTHRVLSVKAESMRDESGRLVLVGIVQDVSRWVSEEYGKIQSLYDNYMLSSNDGYWDWYIQEDYEYMSPRFWEIFGFDPSEKEHKPSAWQDLIFESDLNVALANFEKHVATKGQHPYEQEVRYKHKNGSTVVVFCRGRVVEWDKDGNPIRMVGVHSDITALKQKQLALQEALDFQKLLIDVNTDMIFVKDDRFVVRLANPSFMKLYPESQRDKIIGHTTIESFTPEEAERFLEADRIALEQGESEIYETLGDRIYLTKKIRFEDKSGKTFILGIARDVSALRATEARLEKTNQEFEEFAYRTSHDLRSPLISCKNVLKFTRESIAKNKLDVVARHIDAIEQSLTKMEQLVGSILKITQNRHQLPLITHCNLKEIVERCLVQFIDLEEYSEIEITVDWCVQTVIRTDETLVMSILDNLISNAVKYADPDKDRSFIEITGYSSQQNVVIEVNDNGLGIASDKVERLFSMFSRLHPGKGQGTGLGLYMAKNNAIKLGGDLYYTKSDLGTKFTLELPIHGNPDLHS
ncbi:PAS domain-containing protein [Alteromonas sp. KUL49]|uniref:PAS domain-containing sensor histidine kinase n=1 Tax=Alteromonas sp. KUL49 TaxID=2480798 RepID=UPI00102EF4BB|nr:PAS domain-containing protein [Alteromonas sp. KUL49]TAP37945.1 PAS domain S-box protein [Alteromonas sp. KUL49]GEA12810.1 hypothetical protein KUL49_31850 [Alteromonas sp. KUL49]